MSAGTQSEIRSDAAAFAEARKRLDESPRVPGTVRVHVEAPRSAQESSPRR